MLIRSKRKRRNPDAPQRHELHSRPMTRRELLGQGFLAGSGTVLGGGVMSLFSRDAQALLAADLELLKAACGILPGAGKIPFICFDLAGGANIAGSNVLVGQNGQMDVLSTSGYSKLGLPGDQIPGVPEATPTATSNGDHTDTSLGLAFHSDSAFLRGIQASFRTTGLADNVNGAIIPARSENDTGNNPHNPLYGIQKAGADGEILTLCGSENSESGGNSIAPAMMVNPEFRPTKIDRPEDVVGLAPPASGLAGILGPNDVVPVLESMYRLSEQKLNTAGVTTGLNFPDPNDPLGRPRDVVVEELVRCGYLSSASTTDQFGNVQLDPGLDPNIVNDATGIFTSTEFFDGGRDGREFRKTASVMKMVVDGYAGAGCIEMGGYDYHGGMRQEGEVKDFRAGRCMGACLEYAARMGKPLMMYVFSDGSLSSDGTIDDSVDGRGKGEWSSDNQSTAAGFFLVYNPPGNGGRPALIGPPEVHQQIGAFSADGSVVRSGSPGANNVNLLVEMVVLNYMALHGDVANGNFQTAFPNHGLGGNLDIYTAFAPIVSGPIP